MGLPLQPEKNCALCPRLAKFRMQNRSRYPDKFNAPVPSFGVDNPRLLIVGLAPGLKGANFTGRPFTADYAGDVLYPALLKSGFAKGSYGRHADDGFTLIATRITNAVRCVPPENKPTGEEIAQCRHFLEHELAALKQLRIIIALGTIAHNSVLRTAGMTQSKFPFGHGHVHDFHPAFAPTREITLIDSYHCSRYNINTGRLTQEMFEAVVEKARKKLLLDRDRL